MKSPHSPVCQETDFGSSLRNSLTSFQVSQTVSSLLALALIAWTGSALSETRIAIVADSESASTEALLTAQLANEEELQLLDRSSLNLLEGERTLGPAGAKAKLAGADMLAFVEHLSGTEPPLVTLRVVETDSGDVLLHRFFPDDSATTGTITALAKEIRSLAGEIGLPDRSKRIPVALLGLRFELPQRENPAREYALNQLLALELQQQPGLRVIERWQSEALLFERIAKTNLDSTPESGSLLIDGILSEKPETFALSLRLREGANAAGKRIEIEHKKDDLAGLARAIVAQIPGSTGTGSAAAHSSEAEGSLFSKLSLWALVNGLTDEAIAAAETAALLSPNDPDTLIQRARAYSFRSWPKRLVDDFLQYEDLIPKGFSPKESLQDASHSLLLLRDLDSKLSTSPPLDPERRDALDKIRIRLAYSAACVIRRVYDGKQEGVAAAELAALKRLLKERIEVMATSPSDDTRTSLAETFISWTSAWSENAVEAINSFELLLGLDLGEMEQQKEFLYLAFTSGLFTEFGHHGDRNYSPMHGRLLLSGETRARDKQEWLKCAAEIAERTALRDKILGLTLSGYLLRDNKVELMPVIERLAALVWDERETLTTRSTLLFSCAKLVFSELSQGERSGNIADFNRRYLSYLLEDAKSPNPFAFSILADHHIQWTTTDAEALLDSLNRNRQRLRSVAPNSTNADKNLDLLASKLSRSISVTTKAPIPHPIPSTNKPLPPDSNTLTVRELINPELLLRTSPLELRGFAILPTFYRVFQDDTSEIWAIHNRGIFRFKPDTEEPPRYLYLPGRAMSRPMEALPGMPLPTNGLPPPTVSKPIELAVLREHLAVTIDDDVWVADKNKGNWWEKIPVPPANYSVSGSGERFFLIFKPTRGSKELESGILAYNPLTREVEVIASSLREFSENSPDGRANWTPEFAFPYKNGIVVAGESIVETNRIHELFYRDNETKAWKRILEDIHRISNHTFDHSEGNILTFGDKGSGGGSDINAIVRFPGDGSVPELIAIVQDSPSPSIDFIQGLKPNDTPQWIIPDQVSRVPPDRLRNTAFVQKGDRLYLLTVDLEFQNKRAPSKPTLHVLESSGRLTSIPLRFQVPLNLPNRENLVPDFIARLENSNPTSGALFHTETALYAGAGTQGMSAPVGFWRIPFAEIEAFVTKTTINQP